MAEAEKQRIVLDLDINSELLEDPKFLRSVAEELSAFLKKMGVKVISVKHANTEEVLQ
jgi:hypothetical protein